MAAILIALGVVIALGMYPLFVASGRESGREERDGIWKDGD